MKKIAAVLALLFGLSATVQAGVPTAKLAEFNDYIDQTNFMLNEGGTCSATLIDKDEGYVLTAAHCVARSTKWVVKREGETKEPVKLFVTQPVELFNPNMKKLLVSEIVKYDPNHDLALLKTDRDIVGRKGSPADFGWTKEVKLADGFLRGQSVWAVGNPCPGGDCYNYSITEGIVSYTERVAPYFDEAVYIQSDVTIHGGSSGGAWVNENYEIIAVTSWGYFEPQMGIPLNMNFGISLGNVKEFLGDVDALS
jgi:S1-C subfamily serine protease